MPSAAEAKAASAGEWVGCPRAPSCLRWSLWNGLAMDFPEAAHTWKCGWRGGEAIIVKTEEATILAGFVSLGSSLGQATAMAAETAVAQDEAIASQQKCLAAASAASASAPPARTDAADKAMETVSDHSGADDGLLQDAGAALLEAQGSQR